MAAPTGGHSRVTAGLDPDAARMAGPGMDPSECLVTPADSQAQRCKGLWAAVVAVALFDATRGDSAARSCAAAEVERNRAAARAWLSKPSPDLFLVLERAGMDPEAWPRAVVALRRRWAALDSGAPSPMRRGGLSDAARARISAAARAHGLARAAARRAELAEAENLRPAA